MITQKFFDLILNRVDFNNDELEALVEAQTIKSATAIEAALKMESIIQTEFADDPEVQTKTTEIAEGIVDLASELGSAFPQLSPEQADRFKELFATIFESQSDAVETAGQNLFNAGVDSLQSIQTLVNYVNALDPQ